jgi:hypothetical protein
VSESVCFSLQRDLRQKKFGKLGGVGGNPFVLSPPPPPPEKSFRYPADWTLWLEHGDKQKIPAPAENGILDRGHPHY